MGQVERHSLGWVTARAAGCEWLHVDVPPHLAGFYVDACGFSTTDAGVIRL